MVGDIYVPSNTLVNKPSPSFRRFLMPLKQTTFEIIVANGEIAHNEYIEIFYILDLIISKSSTADLLYVGKG